ncbi:hypothetical protein A2661_03065 [Candidatus Giovannonibacteria bacterium RIFCSPHIGHO2_01_FULL_45_24]|uniref:Uncharacterized protein n=1 Tax=Candidatus Giovannonibacteria bacterium RIFCSPLOWO2_01_FULL_46_32 TaxID=1798353 RepID=A0A1F5XGE1_9BACT|nr:MAG: hypothetical protein A2661_03065 [Candidatus Giovannonibacteria bacterium RIFCSPHIGHO2_01_FULL_45_24]OGF86993.1 MAG: hypothetical protein A3B19_00985 [Candidatus Giovannonibacteria bacterium RIFCSPLOWO2_01_FULL_46_32]
MPIFSWGVRRQLGVFAVFAAIILLVVGWLIYYFRPEPTCFDNKQNQDEEGIDCGGAEARCAPCSEKIRDIAILWTRFFPIREGVYDAAALLENGNQFLKTEKFVYAIKLYDASSVLISIREGTTFIQPGEKFLVFEPNIAAQNRSPKTAVLEMRSVSWETGEPDPLKIDVLRKDIFLADPSSPRLEARVKNQSTSVYRNIEAVALLLGSRDIVLGVSKTKIDRLDIGEERAAVFTWPTAISGVEMADVFLRQIP